MTEHDARLLGAECSSYGEPERIPGRWLLAAILCLYGAGCVWLVSVVGGV